jgi:hypothetical protein
MAIPSIKAIINFSTGPSFAQAMVLGSGALGSAILADAASVIVDVSNQVDQISTQRGRNAQSDQFQMGSMSMRIVDQNGDFNPQNSSGPYYNLLSPMRKVQISATYNGASYNLFSGFITSYSTSTPKYVGDVVYTTIQAVDAFRLFQMAQVSTITGAAAGDLTSTRISQILDTISWPASMRQIDTGNTTVQADPGTSRYGLAAMQTVETTEYGAFYINTDGVAEFHNRNYTTASVASKAPVVFADSGVGIRYFDAQWLFNDTQIYNQANITATGLAKQTATNAASVTKYFLHSYNQQNLLMQTTAEALNYAQAYVASRAETTSRVDAITLDLYAADYDAGITAALSLDFFDPVTITTTQPGTGSSTSTLSKTLQVFGVSHQISTNSWKTTMTTLEPIIDGFIIGSSLYGILGTNVLSY